MAEEDVKFVDAEMWQGGKIEKLTFREIVLAHVKKIGQLSCVEFRGGFWETREVPIGNMQTITQKTYIPDTRECYSNAVEYLFDLLFPHFDKEMRKAGQEAEKEMDKAFKTYTIEPDREDKDASEGERADRIFSKIDDKISYRSEKRRINRKLFRELCCFLKKIRYLEGKTFEEEI